jgi:hypothetical protein
MTNKIPFATRQRLIHSTSCDPRLVLKSYDLFQKRRVLELAKSHLSPEAYDEWLARTLSVQLSIYGLDLYYEQCATLCPGEERPLWQQLENELNLDRHPSNEFLWAGFADLQAYAEVESRLHQFEAVDIREFAAVAQLKCADVRMARGFIWSYGSRPSNSRILRYWNLYDQCWELIEDILDIGEDGTDWNFNFWLYSFMAGGDPVASVMASCRVLWMKLAQLEDAYYRLPTEHLSVMAGSFRATSFATTLAKRCQRRVLSAISHGKVLRFGEQVESAVLVA